MERTSKSLWTRAAALVVGTFAAATLVFAPASLAEAKNRHAGFSFGKGDFRVRGHAGLHGGDYYRGSRGRRVFSMYIAPFGGGSYYGGSPRFDPFDVDFSPGPSYPQSRYNSKRAKPSYVFPKKDIDGALYCPGGGRFLTATFAGGKSGLVCEYQ